MSRLKPARLFAEFVVIVVGVLAALGVDQLREAVGDRATEAQYLERLLSDLSEDSVTLAREAEIGLAKTEQLEGVLAALGNHRRVRSQPSSAWPNLNRTFSQPGLLTTTFDELSSTGRLALIRDEGLRHMIGNHYRRARQGLEGRLGARRTSLHSAVLRIFPRIPNGPSISSSTNFDSVVAARRDSVFSASPNLETRTVYLLSPEFSGLVAEELEYAQTVGQVANSLLLQTIELMAAIRVQPAVARSP